ncbi:MAG: DeoR/GlpR transcriptional regulator [Spirochaetales bacterium]|nr:DeoR/GlpR transcriptional regulator [Spirochaetales bacterium]
MSKRRERIHAILRLLQERSAASIQELAERLSVSEMTIRRDLNLLVQDDLVRLVHAGAVLNPGVLDSGQPRYSLTEAGGLRTEEKQRIGRRAASLIEPEDIVIVDSGSTTEWLVRSLPEEIPLTLLCFALNIVVEAHRHNGLRLVFAGGALHENTLMFESAEGVELVRRYRANKAFISASGVSERLGVTCSNAYETRAKQAAIASSLTRVLVADSSKFGRIQAAHFAELADFEVVVTDSGLAPEHAEAIRDLGIRLELT